MQVLVEFTKNLHLHQLDTAQLGQGWLGSELVDWMDQETVGWSGLGMMGVVSC